MKTALDQVREFHEVYNIHRQDSPYLPPEHVRLMRRAILAEEFAEYVDAEESDDLTEIADALADIIYIAIGTCVAYGIPIDRIFDEVHRSNMSKLDENGQPIYRDDGKVLKGPKWSPPNIEALLRAASEGARDSRM